MTGAVTQLGELLSDRAGRLSARSKALPRRIPCEEPVPHASMTGSILHERAAWASQQLGGLHDGRVMSRRAQLAHVSSHSAASSIHRNLSRPRRARSMLPTGVGGEQHVKRHVKVSSGSRGMTRKRIAA